MNVYIPLWFAIKKKSNLKARSVVNKVMQRNAFYAHPEHILIAMIRGLEQCARELGWRRIFKARMSPSHSARQRISKIPKLRFNFERYFEMIDWQNTAVTEQPVMLSADSSKPIIKEHIKTKMPQ